MNNGENIFLKGGRRGGGASESKVKKGWKERSLFKRKGLKGGWSCSLRDAKDAKDAKAESQGPIHPSSRTVPRDDVKNGCADFEVRSREVE